MIPLVVYYSAACTPFAEHRLPCYLNQSGLKSLVRQWPVDLLSLLTDARTYSLAFPPHLIVLKYKMKLQRLAGAVLASVHW